MTDVTDLEKLLAIEDIKHLKSRYFRFVDQKNWTAWRALFGDDGHFEIGAGSFDGADAFVANVREFLTDATTFHHGHMPEYDVVEPPAGSGVSPFYGYARYWERYERRGGEWKIVSMRIERLRKVDYSR
jgi:hypothetical protein